MNPKREYQPQRTQAEVGRILGMEQSHVGQVERRALAKLRKALAGVDLEYDTAELRTQRRVRREFEDEVDYAT
jgi:transcriptional regulator